MSLLDAMQLTINISNISAAFSSWSRFFNKNGLTLLQLPDDILVDEIFKWLSVRDIVRLRQVCKALSTLTKRPSVWKRFLPYITQIQQPLAPLPPTKMYNLNNLTGHEMETVVARAISYDMAWKARQIEAQNTFGALAFQEIQEIAILPGGHYLVASVKSYDGVYGLVIWSLEHRASQKPAPLFFRRTEVKAYGLTAKYMVVDDLKGIVIGFLRKFHKKRSDDRFIPEIFELGGKAEQEDPYMPLKYECTALFVPMCAIDFFNDRQTAPTTRRYESKIEAITEACGHNKQEVWHPMARIRTGAQLGNVSLDVIDGKPHVCVVKKPNKIVMQVLQPVEFDPAAPSVLECMPIANYINCPHSIWNFRVLPDQYQILVIRQIDKNPAAQDAKSMLTLEMYRMPYHGETPKSEPDSWSFLMLGTYLNVQISEVQRTIPADMDESITPELKKDRHPQPLSIFLRTERGMAHHSLWPVEKRATDIYENPTEEQKSRRYFVYELGNTKHIFFNDQVDDIENEEMEYIDDRDGENRPVQRRKDDALRFLPGARRALVYAIPRDYRSTEPPVTACWGFQYSRKDYTIYLNETENEQEDMEEFAEMEIPEFSDVSTVTEEEVHANDDTPYHPGLDVPLAQMERMTNLGAIALPQNLRDKLLLGVSGICFDEDTGRAVFATKVDNRLCVIDFARTRPRDDEDAVYNEEIDEAMKRDPESFQPF